ncbi:MAG: DUF1697 domain-containing protein [Labilithrix sp.]|nr:DUF1697 domain-containing protein [Labilithrix sp.]
MAEAKKAYAALLRGVSPMNAKMPALVRCFEAAGFEDVRTVLASGNVVFRARAATLTSLEQRAERAMERELGRGFVTIVRPIDTLRKILDEDPYASFRLPAHAKRVVTFLRTPPEKELHLPVTIDGTRILRVIGTEVFTAYVPSPRGAVFMTLLEKTLGKDITTRSWDTLKKLVR